MHHLTFTVGLAEGKEVGCDEGFRVVGVDVVGLDVYGSGQWLVEQVRSMREKDK
jgi:hypothetical protein